MEGVWRIEAYWWSDDLVRLKLAGIEQETLVLADREQASLAAKLLNTLPLPGTDVSDEDVDRREREMESGQVAAISHDDFVQRVQKERRR